MNSEDPRCSESKRLKSRNQVRAKYACVFAALASIEPKSRSGRSPAKPPFPAKLGFEAAGEIEAIGAKVKGFAIGDRVALVPAYAASRYGLYAESSLAPARSLIKIPDAVSFEQAAATWASYGTAWAGLMALGRLAAGQTVLLPAASSSVGLAAIRISKRV